MRLLFILLLLSELVTAQAQNQRYISDQLAVPLRTGTSTHYKIIRMLPSGTPLTVLDSDPSSGYSRVRTEGGSGGFLLTRYLMDHPAAETQLAQLQKTLTPLKAENDKLQQQLSELSGKHQQLLHETQQLKSTNQQLSEELAQIRRTAADAIAIDQRNKQLEQQTVKLERSLQMAQQENEALHDNNSQDWFLRGAGVLLAGLLAGVLLPRLRPRRAPRWGEL